MRRPVPPPTMLLRDDDANATTDPDRFAKTYAPLLDRGIPLALATIPVVALDTRAPDGSREFYLSETTDTEPSELALDSSTPLAGFVAKHASLLDVLQHGLSHARVQGDTEFGSLSYGEARERIAFGADVLTRAFGSAPVGFVAPWDRLSRGSLAAATESFPLVSTSWVDRHTLPFGAWWGHAAERLRRSEALRVGASWVLRHRGGRLAPHVDPADVGPIVRALTHGARVGVIVLHHWMFASRDGAHPVIRALARTLEGANVLRAREVPSRLNERALLPR